MELIITIIGILFSAITFAIGLKVTKYSSEKHLKVYKYVDDSDEDFINDVIASKKIKFFGTTHPNLHDFLKRAISSSNNIENIDIYYANEEENKLLGKSKSEIFKSIQNISKVVCNSENNLNLTNGLITNALKLHHFNSFCGCLIGKDIIYITHFSPHNNKFGTDGLTIRIHKTHLPSTVNHLFEEYVSIIDTLSNTAIDIFKIYPTRWDNSVEEWSKFEYEDSPYMESMRNLIKFITPESGDKILELGCGTGNLTNLIAKKYPFVKKLVVIDSSSQMLEFCINRFQNKNMVDIRQFDPYESSSLGFKFVLDDNYKYVVSHLSFPFPEDSKKDFKKLVERVSKIIQTSGYFIITVHNVVVEIEDDMYERNTDSFINDMVDLFKKYYNRKAIRMLSRNKYSEEEFLNIFTGDQLFKLEDMKTVKYPFKMLDRISMWRVPAILGTLIDLRIANKKDVNDLIFNKLTDKYIDKKTADIRTKTFTFKKI